MLPQTKINISRIIFSTCAVVLLIYLFWQNFSPVGSQIIVYDLHRNKFVTDLNPSTRISSPNCTDSICTQSMFEDPIYFDLLLARNFDLAQISLTYQSKTPIDIRMGMQIKAGWNYMTKSSDTAIEANGWRIATFSFPLSAAWKNNRQVNFMISAPAIKETKIPIEIKALNFELKR